MARYQVSFRTTLVTATVAAALAALKAGSTRPVWLEELHLFYVTAPTTSGGLGLCYSTAVGTGTLTSVTPVARSRNVNAPGALAITNWATAAPTNGGIGTVFERQHAAAAIGNGVFWTFLNEPIEIAPNGATSELCIVNTVATAPGTFDGVAILEE
jgi:hypothetical protein